MSRLNTFFSGSCSANLGLSLINHDVQVTDFYGRTDALNSLLEKNKERGYRTTRTILFVNNDHEANTVKLCITQSDWKYNTITTKTWKKNAIKAINFFTSDACRYPRLLIVTDGALDKIPNLTIPGVECIINYSFPVTSERYLKRMDYISTPNHIGVVHTFFDSENDRPYVKDMVKILQNDEQPIPHELCKLMPCSSSSRCALSN